MEVDMEAGYIYFPVMYFGQVDTRSESNWGTTW